MSAFIDKNSIEVHMQKLEQQANKTADKIELHLKNYNNQLDDLRDSLFTLIRNRKRQREQFARWNQTYTKHPNFDTYSTASVKEWKLLDTNCRKKADAALFQLRVDWEQYQKEILCKYEGDSRLAKQQLVDVENDILYASDQRKELNKKLQSIITAELQSIHRKLDATAETCDETNLAIRRMIKDIKLFASNDLSALKTDRETTEENIIALLEKTCIEVEDLFLNENKEGQAVLKK